MSETINVNTPKYLQVRHYLLEMFDAEGLKPGAPLPKESELMMRFKVGRNTIRHALDCLVNEGIIVRQRGVGSFLKSLSDGSPKKSGVIAVITHTILQGIYPEVIQGIEDTLHNHDYTVLMASNNCDQKREIEVLDRIAERNIDGIICEPAFSGIDNVMKEYAGRLRQFEVPVVFTNCHSSHLRASAVSMDDIRASREGTRYLLERGHKRIGGIFLLELTAGVDRHQGYCEALMEFGVEYDEQLIFSFHHSANNFALAQKAIDYFFSLPEPSQPSALIFYSDEIAVHAYSILDKRGLRIPDDISLISFNDMEMASIVTPPLTTFAHPKYKIGVWAAEMIVEEIAANGKLPPREVFAAVPLIERGSVQDLIRNTTEKIC